MQIYFGLDALPSEPLEPVLTMGNFDGVHRGHQSILGRLQEEAKRVEAPTMVLTFHPHPREILRPGEPFTPIMSIKERARRFWDLDVDHLLVLPFDEDLAEMTADEFVEEILWDALKVTSVFVGPYTTFGHQRGGDVKYLQSLGRRLGFHVGVVDPLYVDGRRISSSRVRDAIAAGRLDESTRLLGRHHRIVGTVVPGDQRGRELGTPTANLASDGGLLPPAGVYAAWATTEDGSLHRGAVVNIGMRPTFDADTGAPVTHIEAHLFDFDGDLYGQELGLALVQHIRGEAKFDNAALLKRQIKRDIIEARRILGLLKA